MEMVQKCVACRRLCEPPLTYVADAAGRLTGHVVCLACLPDGDEPAAGATGDAAELGGEGGG